MKNDRHEELVASLNDPETLTAYKRAGDHLPLDHLSKILGNFLVSMGNFSYGEAPSYGKFKSIEVVARIPYQSWEVVGYMLLTMFYSNEKKAMELSQTSRFSRLSQDNETMHVVVMSQLAKKYGEDNFFWHTLLPLGFSFFYFVTSFLLYLFSPKKALEINYIFEEHAFSQYDRFLELHEKELLHKPVMIDFLDFYGRHVKNEYEFFRSIRNDEIIHRNSTAARILEYNS